MKNKPGMKVKYEDVTESGRRQLSGKKDYSGDNAVTAGRYMPHGSKSVNLGGGEGLNLSSADSVKRDQGMLPTRKSQRNK